MLLLDRLLHVDAEMAIAQLTVSRDALFMQDEGMPSWIGLEYMAQAAAAWVGWHALRENRPVDIGFLLGTRRFEAKCAFFRPGAVLRAHACRELLGDNGLGAFDCQLHDEIGGELARARLSVYKPENCTAYVETLRNR